LAREKAAPQGFLVEGDGECLVLEGTLLDVLRHHHRRHLPHHDVLCLRLRPGHLLPVFLLFHGLLLPRHSYKTLFSFPLSLSLSLSLKRAAALRRRAAGQQGQGEGAVLYFRKVPK
jgi:hypothetical protein